MQQVPIFKTRVIGLNLCKNFSAQYRKETRSVTMNIFWKKKILFKSFVNIELSYVFTINMFITVENCMEK